MCGVTHRSLWTSRCLSVPLKSENPNQKNSRHQVSGERWQAAAAAPDNMACPPLTHHRRQPPPPQVMTPLHHEEPFQKISITKSATAPFFHPWPHPLITPPLRPCRASIYPQWAPPCQTETITMRQRRGRSPDDDIHRLHQHQPPPHVRQTQGEQEQR